jgi:type IVB pilus formation R64 PilN family outer membrane protein
MNRIVKVPNLLASYTTQLVNIGLRFQTTALCSVVIICLGTSGCAIDERTQQSQVEVNQEYQSLSQQKKDFVSSVKPNHEQIRLAQKINKPWVTGASIALTPDMTLPSALRKQVKTTLIFKHKSHDILDVAKRISHVTSIPVRVRAEARLPAYLFSPKLATDMGGQTFKTERSIYLDNRSRPLVDILDQIAAQLNVYWRYTGREIEFYRTETRVFDIRALTLVAKTDAKLGKGASGSKATFESSSQTSLKAIQQPMLEALQHRLQAFMTKAGVLAAQPGALTSVVVTDTPDALDAIEKYIARENRSMSRRVRLVFEEFSVIQKENINYGLDWSLALTNSLAVAQLAMTGGLRTEAGSADLSTQSQGSSAYKAQAVVQAISKHADILRHTTVPVVTLNRRPITHAVRKTFTYVDQIQTSAGQKDSSSSSNLAPSVSVRQREETVGAFLTLVPDVQEDGQILLSVAYDNTVAQPLRQLAFGSGENQLKVQQITVEGNGTVQQVALRAGEPTLIAGFERHEEQNSQSRLAPNAPRLTGGSDQVGQLRSLTLVVVTAQIEEGR